MMIFQKHRPAVLAAQALTRQPMKCRAVNQLRSPLSTRANAKKKPLSEDSPWLMYGAALMVAVGAPLAYGPLHKVYGSLTGAEANMQQNFDESTMHSINGVTVNFESDIALEMPWKFAPTQPHVRVVPGETALTFYSVTNDSDRAITGIATYDVTPPQAASYFNKIQCFCFEEQKLAPREEIEMPVFFYLDQEMLKDPALKNCRDIKLTYTFYKTGEE